MADTSTGEISAAQVIMYMDALASVFKAQFANIGIGASTETTTLAAKAQNARALILGDGATNYGIGNAALQASVKDALATLVSNSRYDAFFASRCRPLITQIESQVASNLPPGWTFTNNTQVHALDTFLLYLNAMHSSTPTTPAAAGTLAGATTVGGGLGTFVSGSCPRVVHCIVGAAGNWFVSLPSPQATQVATTGSQNSLTYQVAGTAPVGSAWMLVFRTRTGGAGAPYYYDGRIAITPSAAYPAYTITNPDTSLLTDWQPPSWASALMCEEAAAIFALAFASKSPNASASVNPLVYSANAVLSPNNVVLNPSNGFLGIGNPPSTGIFGIQTVGTGYVAGAIATTNLPATNTQGTAGAGGAANILQARVTSALNAAGTSAVTYTYYDAAHGWGNAQTATTAAATFGGTAVGSLATYTIPAGRIVQSVTADTTGGGLASGTYVIEAVTPRVI